VATPAAAAAAAADQRFKRIVLRTSCMTDHFPAAYKAGLTDVLQQITKRQQRKQQEEQQQDAAQTTDL
jgi:hypothetical protein